MLTKDEYQNVNKTNCIKMLYSMCPKTKCSIIKTQAYLMKYFFLIHAALEELCPFAFPLTLCAKLHSNSKILVGMITHMRMQIKKNMT